MRMLLLIALTLAACRNEAITYAHLVDPDAECMAGATHMRVNTATCRSHGEILMCRAPNEWQGTSDDPPPECHQIANAPATPEKQ